VVYPVNTWRKRPTLQYGVLIALIAVMMAAGYFFIRGSYAATALVAGESEQGQLAGAATLVNDANASNGQAVSFGSKRCIAPSGLQVTDIDTAHDGDPIPPWRHTLGSPATIYFQTSGLTDEYIGYINDGAHVWNASPCINAVVVNQCPASSNCVRGIISNETGLDYDGQFNGTGNSGYTYLTSGTITFVKPALDKEPVAYKRMVVTHEMGHAVSLLHRLKSTDVMYWASDETVALEADSVNLNNILAVYGVASAATTTPLNHTPPAAETPANRRYDGSVDSQVRLSRHLFGR